MMYKRYQCDMILRIRKSLDRDDIGEFVIASGYLDDVLELRNEMIAKYQFTVSHG
jgi:hypothetical protein